MIHHTTSRVSNLSSLPQRDGEPLPEYVKLKWDRKSEDDLWQLSKKYMLINPYLSKRLTPEKNYEYFVTDPDNADATVLLGEKPANRDKIFIGSGGGGSIDKYYDGVAKPVIKKTSDFEEGVDLTEISRLTAKMEIKIQKYSLNILLNHPKRIKNYTEIDKEQLIYVGKTVNNLTAILDNELKTTEILSGALNLTLQWQALGGIGIDASKNNFLISPLLTAYRVDLDLDFYLLYRLTQLLDELQSSLKTSPEYDILKFVMDFFQKIPRQYGHPLEYPTFFSMISFSNGWKNYFLSELLCKRDSLTNELKFTQIDSNRLLLFFQAQGLFGTFMSLIPVSAKKNLKKYQKVVENEFFYDAWESLQSDYLESFWQWQVNDVASKTNLREELQSIIRSLNIKYVADSFIFDFIDFVLAWRGVELDAEKNINAVNKFMDTLADSHIIINQNLSQSLKCEIPMQIEVENDVELI